MGDFFNTLGSAFSGTVDTLGDVANNVVDKASPLLQSGLNFWSQNQAQKAALKQQQTAQGTSSNKTLWIVGGGIAVVGLLAIVLSRRN